MPTRKPPQKGKAGTKKAKQGVKRPRPVRAKKPISDEQSILQKVTDSVALYSLFVYEDPYISGRGGDGENPFIRGKSGEALRVPVTSLIQREKLVKESTDKGFDTRLRTALFISESHTIDGANMLAKRYRKLGADDIKYAHLICLEKMRRHCHDSIVKRHIMKIFADLADREPKKLFRHMLSVLLSNARAEEASRAKPK